MNKSHIQDKQRTSTAKSASVHRFNSRLIAMGSGCCAAWIGLFRWKAIRLLPYALSIFVVYFAISQAFAETKIVPCEGGDPSFNIRFRVEIGPPASTCEGGFSPVQFYIDWDDPQPGTNDYFWITFRQDPCPDGTCNCYAGQSCQFGWAIISNPPSLWGSMYPMCPPIVANINSYLDHTFNDVMMRKGWSGASTPCNPARLWSSNVPKTDLLPIEKMSLTKDPINRATGEMLIQAVDFAFPTQGPPLTLSRTYRSRSTYQGVLGYGWRSVLDSNLTEDSNGNVVIYDSQSVARYFIRNGVAYTPSPGNFAVLTKNSDGSFIVTSKHGNKESYSAEGRIQSVSDRNGNALTFVVDTVEGYIQDATGRRITLSFDANGRLIAATDPLGRTVSYAYDATNNLISISDPNGGVAQYAYDANHNIVETTNVNGHKTFFAYDDQDRAYTNWQPGDVNLVTLAFQPNNTTVATDSLGNQTTYRFNEYGLEVGRTDALGNTRTSTWDNNLNRTSSTDERGNTTIFEHDGKGNLTQITDALGKTTELNYTPDFNLVQSTVNALGYQTTFTYDTRGNLLSTTDALSSVIRMTYDTAGRLLTTTDPRGNLTNFGYNQFGQRTRTTDALGHFTQFTYDVLTNITSITDPSGATTQFQYDALNRLIKTIFSDGTFATTSYDAYGNQSLATDQKGNTTVRAYDIYERLVQITDAGNGTTSFVYDSEGRLVSLTDAEDHTTSYTYDKVGRLVTETNPIGHSEQYVYDPCDNLVAKTDAAGQTITYQYDVLNRRTGIFYPDRSSVVNAFDALGRQTSMTDSTGVTTFTYDALNRLLTQDGPGSSDIISYAYDSAGNPIRTVNHDGGQASRTYDALNRLATVTDANGTTTYSYDVRSNITRISYPNSTFTAYTYDVLSRPLQVSNQTVRGTTISSFAHVYDAAGSTIRKTYASGQYIDYQYDSLTRLVRETRKQRGKKNVEEISYDLYYSYDGVGNREAQRHVVTLGEFWTSYASKMPQQVLTDLTAAGFGNSRKTDLTQPLAFIRYYVHDADNRVVSWDHNIEVGGTSFFVEAVDYGYDERGNRTLKSRQRNGEVDPQTTYYSYDFESRLTGLQYLNKPTISIHNAFSEYNGSGLRRKAIEGIATTEFLYDGLDVILKRDGQGQTQATFSRAPGFPEGIGGLISAKQIVTIPPKGKGGNTSTSVVTNYFHNDALGSVVNLTDQLGASQASYDYDGFGSTVSEADTVGNTYRFSSKEFISHAGLYYFGLRFYDPEIGRWLTPDPAGLIDGHNAYCFVSNNPINRIDIWGLFGEKKEWKNNYENFLNDVNGKKGIILGVGATNVDEWRSKGYDPVVQTSAGLGPLVDVFLSLPGIQPIWDTVIMAKNPSVYQRNIVWILHSRGGMFGATWGIKGKFYGTPGKLGGLGLGYGHSLRQYLIGDPGGYSSVVNQGDKIAYLGHAYVENHFNGDVIGWKWEVEF